MQKAIGCKTRTGWARIWARSQTAPRCMNHVLTVSVLILQSDLFCNVCPSEEL